MRRMKCKEWSNFTWNMQLAELLASVRYKQGRLSGRMDDALGFSLQTEAVLQILTQDVLRSSEIRCRCCLQHQKVASLHRTKAKNSSNKP